MAHLLSYCVRLKPMSLYNVCSRFVWKRMSLKHRYLWESTQNETYVAVPQISLQSETLDVQEKTRKKQMQKRVSGTLLILTLHADVSIQSV